MTKSNLHLMNALTFGFIGGLLAIQQDPMGKLLINSGWRGLLIACLICFGFMLCHLVLTFIELYYEIDDEPLYKSWDEYDDYDDLIELQNQQQELNDIIERQLRKTQGRPISSVL